MGIWVLTFPAISLRGLAYHIVMPQWKSAMISCSLNISCPFWTLKFLPPRLILPHLLQASFQHHVVLPHSEFPHPFMPSCSNITVSLVLWIFTYMMLGCFSRNGVDFFLCLLFSCGKHSPGDMANERTHRWFSKCPKQVFGWWQWGVAVGKKAIGSGMVMWP